MACESLISSYCNLFGIKGWIFRLGNVIGGRMHRGVMHDLIKKLDNDPTTLEVLGDGRQSRSFILVEDVIDGILHVYKNNYEQGKPCDVYNISTNDSADMIDVVNAITGAMNLNDITITYAGGDRGWKGDLKNVSLNINKVIELGWQPKYNSQKSIVIAAERLVESLCTTEKA